MARIRSIKPSFFTDSDVAELSPLARIAFEGLWCHADKRGRLEDKPRELKVKILPFDDCDFERLLAEIAAPRQAQCGFIRRYTVNGRRFIYITNFEKHQKPHPKEPESEIPEPPTEIPTNPTQPGKETAEPEVAGEKPGQSGGLLSLGSGLLVLGSGNGSHAKPASPGSCATNTLQDKVEAVWTQKRGKAPSQGWFTDEALRPAFDKARGDTAELLRVFAAALDRTYPRLTRLVDLAKHWDDYAATRGPEKAPGRAPASPYARATDADRVREGYSPKVTAEGDLDLVGGAA